jgi:hypothetical protein
MVEQEDLEALESLKEAQTTVTDSLKLELKGLQNRYGTLEVDFNQQKDHLMEVLLANQKSSRFPDDSAGDVINKKYLEVRDSRDIDMPQQERPYIQDFIRQHRGYTNEDSSISQPMSHPLRTQGQSPRYTSYLQIYKDKENKTNPSRPQLRLQARVDEDAELKAELLALGLGRQKALVTTRFEAMLAPPSRAHLPPLSSLNIQREIDSDSEYEI